jgi:ubiquinone/menaquinone biosynthesis C-methylase UbiE
MSQKKLRPMPDLVFKLMVLFMKVEDLFNNPKEVLKKIPLKRKMTVIDYACGPGRYTIPVAKIVGPEGKVYAVDIQHLAISRVKQKAISESLENIKALLVDSFDTGIPPFSADLILLIDALVLIKDRTSLFKEIYRILKPDGLLFMDASHMSVYRARQIVEDIRLFNMVKLEGKYMLWSPKTV